MDGGAWKAAVHGVAKSRTRLSDFTFTFHFHALEKAMAPHSSTLAWRIPGMGEPGGLWSMGSHRVGHDWSDLAVYMFQCFSQFIPHFPSPTVFTSLFCLHLNCCPANRFISSIFLDYIYIYVLVGEGNGNPLQYSCLENPMDGGAW